MTPSFLTAPEAPRQGRLRGLRAGAMGQERRPIQSPHDVGGNGASVAPGFLLLPAGFGRSPAHLRAARFGRALFFHAHREQSGKINRGAINVQGKSPLNVFKTRTREICSGEEISCKG